MDWGMAEHLAIGSLLWEGHHVRLTGQDSRRGTFSHRHAMWMDQIKERKYFPLSRLKPGQGRFDVFNSLYQNMHRLALNMGILQRIRRLWCYGKRSLVILATVRRSSSTSTSHQANKNGDYMFPLRCYCRTV